MYRPTTPTQLSGGSQVGASPDMGMHTSLPDFDMPNEEQVHLAAETFRMLADPTRIKVLWALLQGESSVACLAELAGAAPTAVSQHLAKLRLAGLVKGRREGTFVYYSAADEHVRGPTSPLPRRPRRP
ncbi:metalloregulator ArsR/SmtB family transcription factor [Micromonosporaceae bacterium B7E4]